MSKRRFFQQSNAMWVASALVCLSSPVFAQDSEVPPEQAVQAPQPTPAPQPIPAPSFHHGPVSVTPAGKPLSIQADIGRANRVKQAWLVYRVGETGTFQQVPFRRGSEGPYLATLGGDQVKAPSVFYLIEVESVDGQRYPVFASREAPFRVSVSDDYDDLREKALLARLGGRRSEVTASGEYVMFGITDATLTDANGITREEGVRDHYYRLESGYTYRPLGTVAEFSIRLGLVRGRSVVPGESDESQFDVGLNYASPRVRFRVNDSVHVETELLTSVTEVGFSMGAGGALLLGDPYGSRITFGFESVQTFGTRMYTRMDIDAGNGVLVAPVIEVTDMPHADRYGVRLLSEVGIDAGSGFRISARGGYQARTFTSGGPSGGASLFYAF